MVAGGSGLTAWVWSAAGNAGRPAATAAGLGTPAFPLDVAALRAEHGVDKPTEWHHDPIAWKGALVAAVLAGVGNWPATTPWSPPGRHPTRAGEIARCGVADLQDAICDRLAAAKIGPGWVDGPLHVAASVVNPAFVPADRSDGRPKQFASAVGWPVYFCEAVIGANAVLAAEADRRSLAITLFSRVPPRPPGVRATAIPGTVSRPVAVWAALRGHGSACRVECPLQVAAAAAVQAVEAGEAWPGLYAQGVECESAPGRQNDRVAPKSPAAHHAAVALRYADTVMPKPSWHQALEDVFREAAKVEAKVHGVSGAAAFCLTLAELLGLTVT